MNVAISRLFVITVAIVLAGCGQSERESKLKAELDQLRSEKEARLAAEIEQLRKDKEQRRKAELEEIKKAQENFAINGSVFIVAKSGVNYKLALVPVTVSSLPEYESARSSVGEIVHKEREALLVEFNKASVEERIEAAKLKREYAEYEKLNKEVRSLAQKLESIGGRGMVVNTVSERISIMTPQSESMRRALAGMYPSDAIIAEAERLVEKSKLRKEAAERVDPIKDAYDKIWLKLNRLRERAEKLENAVLPMLVTLLTEKNGVQAKSDADGSFSVSVERKWDTVILTGAGTRSIGKKDEKYFWKKEVSVAQIRKDTKIFLSNSELIDPSKEMPGIVGHLDRDFPKPDVDFIINSKGVYRIERY